MSSIDQAALHFNAAGFMALNAILGLIMFGVALDLKVDDFVRAAKTPRAPAVGLFAQFVLLPAASFLLTRALALPPSVAMGMILVAACPGGNVSNFITHLAGGNTAVSVSMTAISTAVATVMTPINIALWGSMSPETSQILRAVNVDPVGMLLSVFVVLALPLVLGMLVAAKAPGVAARLRRPMRILSLGFFVVFVVVAFRANVEYFTAFIGLVFGPVLLQNALALGLGYGMGRAARLDPRDVRAVAVEVGIQNSGLGLVLVFTYFGGLGGMAVVTAWWGIWHIIAGLSLAFFWARRPLASPPMEAST